MPVTRRSFFTNLAVAKQVARRDQFIRQTNRFFVVGVVIVAIGKMEWIDVPIGRSIALLDDVKRELVSRRDDCAARLSLGEKLLLAYFFGLGVMGDENDVDVVVLGSQEAYHPEIKTTRDVFLKLTHRTRDVDHRNDYGIRLVAHHLFPRLESQVFLLDVAKSCLALARVATNVFENHPALIKIGDHTGAPDLVELSLA